MNIVVYCPNLIGDTVMATPALRSLRAGFPDAKIHALVKPVVAPVLDGLNTCDHRILFDPRSSKPELQASQVLKQLRGIKPDLTILLPNSFRSALMGFRSGSRRRVGYARGGRGILLTDRIAPPNRSRFKFEPIPVVDYYLGLTRHLGCPDMGRQLDQATLPANESDADSALSELNIANANPLIVFNTGGAFGPAKNWPSESFASLSGKILKDIPKARILVICGPSEVENANKIATLANDERVLSLSNQPLSVGLSKAIIKRANLMVTTDSGPRHFATAFGIPTVSLFGPTHIAWTRTLHPQAIHLQKKVDCGPCQQGVCPEKHHRCMTELTPDDVHAACLELLGWERLVPDPKLNLGRARPPISTRLVYERG